MHLTWFSMPFCIITKPYGLQVCISFDYWHSFWLCLALPPKLSDRLSWAFCSGAASIQINSVTMQFRFSQKNCFSLSLSFLLFNIYLSFFSLFRSLSRLVCRVCARISSTRVTKAFAWNWINNSFIMFCANSNECVRVWSLTVDKQVLCIIVNLLVFLVYTQRHSRTAKKKRHHWNRLLWLKWRFLFRGVTPFSVIMYKYMSHKSQPN